MIVPDEIVPKEIVQKEFAKDEIAKLIPHADDMCLLDRILHWDKTSIRCTSSNHRDRRNPLANGGRLNAICGLEYAAQAMASHGQLTTAGGPPESGYLASVRDVVCHVDRLDLLAGDLLIEAEQLLRETDRVIYRFSLRCADVEILSGRAAVILRASYT